MYKDIPISKNGIRVGSKLLCISTGSGVVAEERYTATKVFMDIDTKVEFVGIKETGDNDDFRGKFVTRFKIIDDACGNCKNGCRADERCPFYQEVES